jgi:hypothetical protein
MGLNDKFHNSQTKPSAPLLTASSPIHPIKPFKKTFLMFRSNTFAIIRNINTHGFSLLADMDTHLPTLILGIFLTVID